MNDNIKALDEIHKGACMGKNAIGYVLDKVKDKDLKKELEKELSEYKMTINKISEIYPNYNDGNPQNQGAISKAMTWSGIEMETLMDKTNTKISEILLKGLNMGIVEGRKVLNNKNLDKEVNKVISEFVTMQEESVEALKKYL